jgi:His-Xaa-Ser system protein HxsD
MSQKGKTAKKVARKVQKEDGYLRFKVSKKFYSKDALYGTAYVFLDRCYVQLDVADEGHYLVAIRPKPEQGKLDLNTLAGEFENELINEEMRIKLAKETLDIRTKIVGTAIAQSMPLPSEEEPTDTPEMPDFKDLPPEVVKILKEEDEDLDFLEDPLGIAVPWEEKYGKGEKGGEKK